jgi:hypothetical protein
VLKRRKTAKNNDFCATGVNSAWRQGTKINNTKIKTTKAIPLSLQTSHSNYA